MCKRNSQLFAKLAVTVLFLAFPQIADASAENDLKIAWNRYRDSCNLYRAHERVWNNLKAESAEAKRKWKEYDCWNADAGNEYCNRFVEQVLRNSDTLESFKPYLESSKNSCDQNRDAYSTALSEFVIQAVLTGPEPNPNAARRRPPSKNVKRPYKRRRKPPPNRGLTDEEAAAIIGGIIIQGISKGTKKGTKKSHPSSRPGYIP